MPQNSSKIQGILRHSLFPTVKDGIIPLFMIKIKYLSGFFGNFLYRDFSEIFLMFHVKNLCCPLKRTACCPLKRTALLFSLILFPSFPPSLSTDDVSSERPLLCNLLPSVGITRLPRYYETVRLPVFHLPFSLSRLSGIPLIHYCLSADMENTGSPQLTG